MPVVAEQHDADFVLVHVERDAEHAARETHELLEAHAGKARHLGDAGRDADDRAHLARRESRREALARLADAGERARRQTLCKLSGVVLMGVEHRASVHRAWARLALRRRLGFGVGLGLGFRLVLLLQKLAHALFQRREVLRDAPAHSLPVRGELDPADQVRRGLEPDADLRREGLVERILYRRALLRGQLERAAHERRVRRRLEGLAEPRLRRTVHLSQAAGEHLAHALLQARRGEIRQRLSRDGEHLLLGPAPEGLIEVLGVLSQRLLSLRAQGVGRLSRFVEEPLTLRRRLVRRLLQECRALLVEFLVLVLELVALLLGLGLLRGRVRELRGDPLLPRVDGVRGWACRESASSTTPG